jgi:hypothetical protein
VKRPVPTERQVQRAILQMMGICFPAVLVAHVPNGAHLAGTYIARFKQMGALKGDGLKIGFPDLICIWNHGVSFIEVKRPGCAGRVSPEQVKIHAQLTDLGFTPGVVTSPDEAFAFLKDCGAPTSVRQWGRAAA